MFDDKKLQLFKKLSEDVSGFSESLRLMSSSAKTVQDALIKLRNLFNEVHIKNK